VNGVGFVAAGLRWPRRWLLASLAVALLALLALPWQPRHGVLPWMDAAAAAPVASAPPADADPAPPARPVLVHAQSLIAAQSALLAKATDALGKQTPGRVDLYAVGFAGDSEEPVFRNEVDYLGQLLARRFGADGRVLSLVNSFDTVAHTPIASLTNLRQGLKRVATKMDPTEDVLLLFLTSHGSREHELLVELGDLPLHQVDPKNLRAALDESGIRWRVVVVSACFSGGFVRALQDPHTLVITAARSDRTSFGCGSDSEITWFGKAFFAEALNETTDFREAFAVARKQIRAWEREDGITPSWPQISEGALIGAKLDALRANLPPAPVVPFVPTVPAPPAPDGDAG